MHEGRLADKEIRQYNSAGWWISKCVCVCVLGGRWGVDWRKMNGLMDRSLNMANKDRWEERWRMKRNASADSRILFEAVHN